MGSARLHCCHGYNAESNGSCHYSLAACVTQLNAPVTWHRVKSATRLKSVIKPASSTTTQLEAGRRRRCQRPQPRPGIHCAGHIHPHHIRASLERSDWHALRLRQCLPPIPAAAAAEVTCRFPRRRDVASDNRLCEHACATAPTAGRRVGEKWGGGWLNESWEGVSVPALTNG